MSFSWFFFFSVFNSTSPLCWGLHRLATEKGKEILFLTFRQRRRWHQGSLPMRQGLEILLEQKMEVALCVLNLNGIVTVVLCGPRNMPPVQSHSPLRWHSR